MVSVYTPNYIPMALKGAGSFGFVIEAYDESHNCLVALKRTHKVGPIFNREYEILSKIKDCEYCVRLLDLFYTINDKNKIGQNLIFEFVPSNLDKYMKFHQKINKDIPIQKIKKISKQLLLALNFIHKKYIVHRDLTPENILLTKDENIKICDFGSSKIIKNFSKDSHQNYYSNDNESINIIKSTPYTVSRFYRAPELFFGKCDYNSKIDIFSIGLIIGELFTLKTLFKGVDEGMQILEYINVLGMPDLNYLNQFNMPKCFKQFLKNYKPKKIFSLEEILKVNKTCNKKDIEEACDLLYNMLNWDYNERFSAEDCLKHKFFEDVDFE